MKDYVQITSTTTINVTPGLQGRDVTNEDAHVPDRFRVTCTWPKCVVTIKQGFGIYPSELLEWNTVKRLAELRVFTIGQFVDGPEGDAVDQKELIDKNKEDLEESFARLKRDSKKPRAKKTSLEDLSGKDE